MKIYAVRCYYKDGELSHTMYTRELKEAVQYRETYMRRNHIAVEQAPSIWYASFDDMINAYGFGFFDDNREAFHRMRGIEK